MLLPSTTNSVWCEQQYRHGGMQQALHMTARHTHQKQQRQVSCHVRARKAARALHDTRHSTKQEKKDEEKNEKKKKTKSSVRRWRRSSR
nr:MAG TPA: hypothetical protein [Caudoviricetes sp.]